MHLGRAVGDLGRVVPRWIGRTQAQAEFLRALFDRSGCERLLGGMLIADADADSRPSGLDEASTPGDRDGDESDSATVEAPLPGDSPVGASSAVEESPNPEELAIPGYESLAAAQIVPRLQTLSESELTAIRSFETANRQRRTVLNRIDQLLKT